MRSARMACASCFSFLGRRRKKVAILGGAFDPPTLNHMLGAAEVIHSKQADEVWLVPCGYRPDKPNLSPALPRYIMTQISVNTSFSPTMPIFVSDEELPLPKTLPTYDLLNSLRTKYPDNDFVFVIGSDWLSPGTDLRDWTSNDPVTGEQTLKTGEKLVSEFDFLVIPRPGYEIGELSKFGPRMRLLEMPSGVTMMEGNLSSSEIRKRLATDTGGESPKALASMSADLAVERIRHNTALIEGLVCPGVLAYINRKAMYANLIKTSGVESPSRRKRRNVAVFGGAFDPPTHSHMVALAQMLHSGLADEAVLVPCGPRPDKPGLRSPLVRYCMCELAVNSSFSSGIKLQALPLEVFEKESLATYDSLSKLRFEDPDANFMFVVGSDWLQPGNDIRKWTSKCPTTGKDIVTGDKLVSEFDFIVLKRPGYEVEDLKAFGPRMKWLQLPHQMGPIELNLSSTEVRKRADISYRYDKGMLQLLDGLVPTGVFNYIRREKVYMPKA